LACGVAVRGGGERGLGRSSGAGALTTFAENRFPEWDTVSGDDKSGAAADVGAGAWSSTAADSASISVVDRALTKRDEVELLGGGSEKGSRAYGLGPVTRCWFGEGPGLGLGDGGAECKGLATMSSSRTWSSDV